jgi:hypothetical protein
MMELRSVISRTVQKYDVFIPERENFDENKYFDGIKDHFTMGAPPCKILFQKRSES